MTVKGKRDGALRKMSHQEASSYRTGGFVDESFPAKAVHLALRPVANKVDAGAFDAFFGPRLGRYRALSQTLKIQPSVADELALVKESMDLADQLRLRLEHLPSTTKAHLNAVCWKHRSELFQDFRSRLDASLEDALTLLMLAERELEPHKGNPGRKSASLRDRLLHDVAHQLEGQGIRKEEAAEVAAAVLSAVDVDAPCDPREARKLVSKVEKLSG